MIIENVPEYKEHIIAHELGSEWKIVTAVLDPRALGVPASRSRIYAIAWMSSKVQWRPEVHLETVIEALTSRLVADASIFYWMDAPKSTLTPAQDNWLNLVSDWGFSSFCLLTRYKFFKGSEPFWLTYHAFPAAQASVKEKVLHDYRTMKKVVEHPDLQQYPKNGRGRGECSDGSLQTLTTNSSKIYSEETCKECNSIVSQSTYHSELWFPKSGWTRIMEPHGSKSNPPVAGERPIPDWRWDDCKPNLAGHPYASFSLRGSSAPTWGA